MSGEIDLNAIRLLAEQAHEGQFRRDGVTPYIEHVRAVAGRVHANPEAEAVAWLHDVIEDTEESAESLLAQGVPEPIVRAVELLTRTEDSDYESYIQAVRENPLATQVKIADMLSNLADKPTRKQIRKYAHALLRLTEEG